MRQFYISILIAYLCPVLLHSQEFRSIDGHGNNTQYSPQGAILDLLTRRSPIDYIDGIGIPKLDESFSRPNPRFISNKMFAQDGLLNSALSLSDYTWVFGQFIDHDLTFVLDDHSQPLLNISAPSDDLHFQPGTIIPMNRSAAAPGTGEGSVPRQYQNNITSYLDGSAVYGSTTEVSNWLRSFKDGKLKVSNGNLLPWNTTTGEFNIGDIDLNAPHMDDPLNQLDKYFVAGDARANENPLLIAMHTIFVREHNRLCDVLKQEHPFWTDELLFQHARRLNIAQIQKITFDDWLPAMGVQLPNYNGYKSQLKVTIFNEFSAAAFRFGHTLINSNIIRMENGGNIIKRGNINLKDAFFNPFTVVLSGGIEPFVKGMGTQVQQELDCKVIDDVRNFLFNQNGTSGLDLAAININRGRERGIGDYNTVRSAFGLPTYPNLYELTNDPEEATLLESVYGSIDNVDLWVGLLAEKHSENAMMGRLMQVILKEQFQLLRDGDRFYYKNDPMFTVEEITSIDNTDLHDIIMRNTDIDIMQENVFKAVSHEEVVHGQTPIPVDLDAIIYPTLVDDYIKVKLFANVTAPIRMEVLNMQGSILQTFDYTPTKGQNEFTIDIRGDINHGAYLLLIYNDSSYTIKKFIKS